MFVQLMWLLEKVRYCDYYEDTGCNMCIPRSTVSPSSAPQSVSRSPLKDDSSTFNMNSLSRGSKQIPISASKVAPVSIAGRLIKSELL